MPFMPLEPPADQPASFYRFNYYNLSLDAEDVNRAAYLGEDKLLDLGELGLLAISDISSSPYGCYASGSLLTESGEVEQAGVSLTKRGLTAKLLKRPVHALVNIITTEEL
jgi:hypothetical protein